jgi:hypothetical protein
MKEIDACLCSPTCVTVTITKQDKQSTYNVTYKAIVAVEKGISITYLCVFVCVCGGGGGGEWVDGCVHRRWLVLARV